MSTDPVGGCSVSKFIGPLACAIVCLFPATLNAQTFVRQDCRSAIGASPSHFDDQTHRLWYRRFWNGSCAGLSFCTDGSPNWNDAVGDVLRQTPVASRRVALKRACQLGRLIGYEWARDNGVRKIDTGDLQDYMRELSTSADSAEALDNVERSARSKLGAR